MKVIVSEELKSRLTNAASNGSIIASDILAELKNNSNVTDMIKGNANYFSTKRKKQDGLEYQKVKIVFTEGLLGTTPGDEEIYRNFIGKKAPDASTIEDEVAAIGVDEVVEKGMTVFPRNKDGNPFLYDYQVKGFLKDACSMLTRVKTTESSKLRAYKKIIDGLVFVSPRIIPLNLSGDITVCQRPLRAQTAQGERITLSISEETPAGTSIEVVICLLDDALEKPLMEWLEYGELRGIGQWRNSGKGRFTYTMRE